MQAVVAPAPPAAAASTADPRWRVDLSTTDQQPFVPSVQRSVDLRTHCRRGEIDRLPTEQRVACLKSWGEPARDANGRLSPGHGPGPVLSDPKGEFAKAAAKAERRREQMLKPPIGQCPIDRPGSNLGFGCS
jgi:hypothetical protein